MARTAEVTLSSADSLLQTFDIHSRITGFLIASLDPKALHAATPDGKGRDIASLLAHMQNVHVMWLRAAGVVDLPPALDKTSLTSEAAAAGLEQSYAALRALIASSLTTGARIKGFRPDTTAFVGYLISHDSHHRGQISMLARQAGFPLDKKVNFGLWEWGVR